MQFLLIGLITGYMSYLIPGLLLIIIDPIITIIIGCKDT
jgi:hypothetical protein